MNGLTCKSCEYFNRERSSNWGECRAKAPVAKKHAEVLYASRNAKGIYTERAIWPMVEDTDWCGELSVRTDGEGNAPL